MGADIHGWVEKKVDGKWVAFKELHDDNRIYSRFGALANVREPGPFPRGIPTDISDTTKLHIEQWGSDGHSHSYLSIADAFNIFKRTSSNKDYDFYDAFDFSHREEVCPKCGQKEAQDNYRLVFWFDN